MAKQTKHLFARVSKGAKNFFDVKSKAHGSLRKYLLTLVVKDGYKLTNDDL